MATDNIARMMTASAIHTSQQIAQDTASSIASGNVVSIATPDANYDVTHPSVVHVPGGWNGFQYWMAITGMPEARENPMIFCSNDGDSWEPPVGLTNPVFPLSWTTGKGYVYCSDTDIKLIDGTMWMLFRTVDNIGYRESIWLSKSIDGITWSDPSNPLWTVTSDAAVRATVSPTLVVLPTSGIMAIFTVKYVDYAQAGANIVEMRISTDGGVTWGEPVTCVTPDLYNSSILLSQLWHTEVQSYGGHLHMLGYAQTGKLHYFESFDDGATWIGNVSPVIGPNHSLSTAFYRSSFQPSAVGDGWDIWAADWTAKRVRHFRNIDLTVGTADLHLLRGIWIPAEQMSASVGALTTLLGSGNGRLMGFRLAENALGRVSAAFLRPNGWKRMRATLYWINDGAGTGNVHWRAVFASYATGDNVTAIGAGHDIQGSTRLIAAGAQTALMKTVMSIPGADSYPGEYTVLLVSREGADSTDTLENRVLLLGVNVEPC